MDIPRKIYKTISDKELIISFSLAIYMNFMRWNLSPLLLFLHTTNIRMNWRSVGMNVALTNNYYTESKRALLADYNDYRKCCIMLFGRKYLLA